MKENSFKLANSLPILEVLDAFNLSYKKKWAGYVMIIDGKPDDSFSIDTKRDYVKDFWKTWQEWKAINIIWQLVLNLSIDELQQPENQSLVIKAFQEKGLIPQSEYQKQENTEPRKHEDILEQFHSLTLGWYNSCLQRFLQTRWFDYEWIHKNSTKIWEVFKDIGYLQTYYCSETQEWEAKNTQVLLFPTLDQQGTFKWFKIRRVDGKTIRWLKSPTVWGAWLLYTDVSLDSMIIVEGETDYIVLKLLWYDNVVANLWWVQSMKKELKELLSDTKNIICLYDNDTPWQLGTKNLQEYFKRQILTVEYPIRKDKYGKTISDINDFYKAGYNSKQKWDKILKTAKPLGVDDTKEEYNQEFIFLRDTLEYYDIKKKKIQQTWPVAAYLGLTPKELASMVRNNQIRMYEDLCYREGWKDWYYNTLDESVILKNPWDAEPVLHPHIQTLIDNIANNKQKEAEWIHQSILYKLTHINDPYLPALVLYWPWASGKWTLLNLLSKIFWEDNMLTGLWQKDLEWSFDGYQWNKLVVEYKEVSSWNTMHDKKIMDAMKAKINERYITVNAKFQNVRQIENIARFHFSSNHAIPLQLDSWDSGNRRFTIIKTWHKLDPDIAREMNEVTFNNPQTILEYISRLYHNYPDVSSMTHFPALQNATKTALEQNCESSSNLFFQWVEQMFPRIQKITNLEKNKLLIIYCKKEWEDENDIKFKQKNFDLWLSHKYEKKMVKIRGKNTRWYYIHKTEYELEKIPDGELSEFKEGELDKLIF